MTDTNALREASNVAGYAIERLIRQEGEAAFFAVASSEGERLLMKVIPGAGESAGRQLSVWERSRHLRHPNIVHLRDPGRTEFAGESYIYALFEYPDDSLATALENGPISEDEARAVLDAALSALRYLHSQGMVHGAVTPGNVVAVGNEIKLTTDALSESDDLEGPMEDVRQLGELVRTIRAPEPVGEPLATVVQHAADADARHRWTLAEIARELDKFVPPAAPPVVVEAPVQAEAAPAATAAPIEEKVGAGDLTVRAESVSGAALLQEAESAETRDPHETRARAAQEALRPAALDIARRWEDLRQVGRRAWERFSASDMPKWPFAAAAVLVLLILLLNRHHNAPVQRATSYTPAAVTRPVVAPPAAAPAPSGPATWRVIAFTYKSRRMAARKAKEINHRWPELEASVLSPKERHGYYLVTLGRPMDRGEATELQRKAHTLGLPRDTYLENNGGE